MSENLHGWPDDWAYYYDHMDVDRGAHVRFYASLVTPQTRSLLDLGCGTGSITLPVVERLAPGARVVGVDLSPGMIEIARARAPHHDWRVGDLSRPPVQGHFDLILVCYHTMQMLLDPADFRAALASIAERLSPNGRFAFDIYQPNAEYLAGVSREPAYIRQFRDGEGRPLDIIETDTHYDAATKILYGNWSLVDAERQLPLPLPPIALNLRQYAPDDVQTMLAEAGLRVTELWGDLDRKPFTPQSKLQIYVCELA